MCGTARSCIRRSDNVQGSSRGVGGLPKFLLCEKLLEWMDGGGRRALGESIAAAEADVENLVLRGGENVRGSWSSSSSS